MRCSRSPALAVLVLVLWAHGVVQADVAMPRDRWTDISLVSEHVTIVLGPGKVTVRGTFDLKNEKDAVTAVIGYPRGMLEKSLNDFTVTVDGKAVEVDSQEGQKETRPGMSMPPGGVRKGGPVKSAYQFQGPYPEWKTFNVSFDAGQKRTLVVSYHVEPAEINTTDNGKLLAYIYTLKTGASWKGKIGKAVIEMKLDGLSMADIVTVTPKQTLTKADAARSPLVWEYKNFKPTHDIEVTFRKPEAQAKK